MDRFELVEKLVKSTGVSFADAKTALEATGWDLLDAAVWLEKNGKVSGKTNHFSTNPEQQQKQQKQQEEERRKEERRKEAAKNTADTSNRGLFHSIIRKAREIIMDNELIICKRSGDVFLEIPIWLFVILLIVSFWPVVIVLALLFFIGFRFRLHGPDLGTESINRVLNRAENAAGDFIERVKNQNNSSKHKAYDATHGPAQTRSDDGVIDYEEPHREE